MKKFRAAALALAAVLTVSSMVGCKRNTGSDSSSSINIADMTTVPIGENKITASVGQSTTVNDTVFTLNSVISPADAEAEGKRYVYFDITINNNSSETYSLSTLNNFYLTMSDGTDVYSDVRTELYAMQNFKEGAYFSDPFDIAANSTFSGVVGGFLVDKNAESFSVGFFPTKGMPTAKGDVIIIDVNANDIIAPSAELLK